MPTTRDLFFWLPKVLDVFEQPLEWVLLLLVLALVLSWRRRDRAAKRAVVAATLLLAVTGVVAVPETILRQLEDAYPPARRSLAEFEGVMVLGGGLEGGVIARERGQTLLNASAERVTAAAALARAQPDLKMVVTGYAGVYEDDGIAEAVGTIRFFQEQGLPTTNLIPEPTSRNTFEIAENSKTLAGVDPSRPWLLLTSAWNMPRALLTFRKAGWNVEPWPVDYRTGTTSRYWRYSIQRGASTWSLVLHELLGITWYRITGRL